MLHGEDSDRQTSDGQTDGRTDGHTGVQLHMHSTGTAARGSMPGSSARGLLTRGRACEAAGLEPAASAVEGRHVELMPTRMESTSVEPARMEPASAMPTSVVPTSEQPTSVEPASAMPTSAMAMRGVAALPQQHGNVSEAKRGWEARLMARIRARCARWASGRQSHLKALMSPLSLAGGRSGCGSAILRAGPGRLGAAAAVDMRATRLGCARRVQRVRLTARTPIVVGKLPRSRCRLVSALRAGTSVPAVTCVRCHDLPCHNSTQHLGVWWCLGGEVAGARRRVQAERAQGGAAEGSGAP